MISIIIPGEPISKKRPRFRKNGFTYDEQCNEKELTKWSIKEQINKNYRTVTLPLKGVIYCEFYFYMGPTESWSKIRHNLISWDLYDHTNKPDIDNLVKFYLDCMNEILYEDDKQINSISVQKYYSKEPRTEIRIMGKSRTIVEKVEDILGNLSSEEFGALAADLETVADCLCMDFINNDAETKTKLQLEAAYMLSLFADKYGAMLNNINKKYPGIWKQIGEYEKRVFESENKEICINGCYPPNRGLNHYFDTLGNEISNE